MCSDIFVLLTPEVSPNLGRLLNYPSVSAKCRLKKVTFFSAIGHERPDVQVRVILSLVTKIENPI